MIPVDEDSGSAQNAFVSRGKYYICGLNDFLRRKTRGEKKATMAALWKIPLRTLGDIERLSAISFPNWQKLRDALGREFQKLDALCPEGWGGNKHLTTRAVPLAPHLSDSIKWKFIEWDVDVRIENLRGDAEYQTSVRLQNITNGKLRASPLHSIWAETASGVSVRDIRAYDQEGQLKVEANVNAPAFLAFRVKPRQPIAAGQMWRYWWEVSWPQGYADWKETKLIYKGESPVNQLTLRVVLPHVLKPVGHPILEVCGDKVRRLPWLKLHGRDAAVIWRREVPISETVNVVFRCKQRKR